MVSTKVTPPKPPRPPCQSHAPRFCAVPSVITRANLPRPLQTKGGKTQSTQTLPKHNTLIQTKLMDVRDVEGGMEGEQDSLGPT